ncbi:non-ribosomal peptide synthetase [Amycolatopsis sp. YIM 10]|uniref:non-ribosomal peptide synthetase n=1 Tax=Amycolatopsis sp. YIM 10 TaxID=2653857 RepID=UPI0012A8EDA2|nr:non-ribosomal peptide synthetase [Amycolatopsis sp. YIM 10]QFU90577.1 Linear gramicidin synthase subunit B [Amycolatopsis sp. YIM 10]
MHSTETESATTPVLGRAALLALAPGDRAEALADYLRERYGQVTRRPAPADPDEPLFLESLQATELQLMFEAELGVALSLAELAETPSTRDIAELLAGELESGNEAAEPLPVVVPDPERRFEPFGLTDVQHAYWLGRSGLFELGDVSTHVYAQFESADFELERANRALSVLVERHDMLRAVVRADGRQQVVVDAPPVGFGWEDLSGLGVDEAWARVAEVRDRLSHEVRPSDRFPLFEFVAQRLPDGRARVHLSLDLLIADAISIQVLFGEWSRLYTDPESVLPPVGLTFRDYLAAVECLGQGPGYERAREYWMARIHTLPPAPELPTVPPVAGTPTRFTRRQFVLGPTNAARLAEIGESYGVTPSVVLCGAFAEVLGVWSKGSRFTVNVTVGDRLPVHSGVDGVVGDFTGLVLLEVDSRSAGSFGGRVRVLQERLWRDLEHRAFGGVRVLRELARAHGVARGSMPIVFTSMLGRDMPGAPGVGFAGLGAVTEVISQTPQVHIDLQAYEQAGSLVVSWDSVDELFADGVLDEMFRAFGDLVERLAGSAETWELPGRLVTVPAPPEPSLPEPVLPPIEFPDSPPTSGCVSELPYGGGFLDGLVLWRAVGLGGVDAVVWSSGVLSFGDLVVLSRRVGWRLRGLGVGVGDLVGVCLPKGWEQVVSVLGVLGVGAGFVPVDPGWPVGRRDYVWGVTGVGVVLSSSVVVDSGVVFPEGVVVVLVDGVGDWVGVSEGVLPVVGRSVSDVAYVIFTSGSTGVPKGVAVDHRGAVNTVVDVCGRWGVGVGDAVLGVSSLSFDLSVWDVFGVLGFGGRLVLPDGGGVDPGHWLDLVRRFGVTVWNSVPALFELFVEWCGRVGGVVGLRLVLLSGDWIPVSLPGRAWSVLGSGVELVSLGGATEASIWSICFPIVGVDSGWSSVPYGVALGGQSVYVLDEWLERCPVWVAGELFIGGVGVALGYWGDAERTAGSFVVHPVSGERLYRTGDVGRYLPDGVIEFLGREDFQVKVGGFRIELGEVEVVLGEYPGVSSVVVVAVGDPRGSRRLVAYVVGVGVDGVGLREWARERLPEYMVPSAVVLVDGLPLTGNGKVDRAALPDPDRVVVGREFVEPRSPGEVVLARVWCGLLNRDRISTGDNVFELGADSLLALRATAAIDGHGLRLSLRDIFDNPTIAAQAQAAQATRESDLPAVVPDPERRFEPFGLTDVQHAYWLGRSGLFELGDVSTHLYLELESADFDLDRADRVLESLVERHDMLRAVVRADGRQQVVVDAPPVGFGWEDLSGLGVDEAWARVAEVRDRLSHEVRPSDRFPLFEFVAQRLPDGRARVHLSLDLLIADASSVQILLTEFARLYADPDLELPPVGLTFRDYLAAVECLGQGPGYERAKEYWMARIHTLPPAPDLPVRTLPDGPTRFVRNQFRLDASRWERIKAKAHTLGVTPSVVLCGAFAEVLGVWSKGSRFTVNVTVGDRLPVHSGVDGVVGDFTGLVLLEVDSRSAGSFGGRVRVLQERLWRDLEHRAFGGVRVLRELARAHGVARGSMPIVFTSVLGREMPGDSSGALPGLGRLVDGVSQTPQLHLDHQVFEIAGELVVSWDSVDGLFADGVVDGMFGAFRDFVERLAEDDLWAQEGRLVAVPPLPPTPDLLPPAAPDVPELPWEPEPVPSSALTVPGPGAAGSPAGSPRSAGAELVPVADSSSELRQVSVSDLFFGGGFLDGLVLWRAVGLGGVDAVVWSSGVLSFGDLVVLSRRVGWRLRGLGVGVGDLVGVCLPKGWEQVVSVLGVLGVGAGFVPVDPGWPVGRRDYVWGVTGVGVVLSSSVVVDSGVVFPEGVVVVLVDGVGDWVGVSEGVLPVVGRSVSDVAYVIFTSGSTGVPKGVAVDHRGAVNTVVDVCGRWGVGVGDAVLGVSSLSFDLSVWDVFGVLGFGGRLVLPDGGGVDPGHWLDLVRRFGVTVWNSVPALFELFVEWCGRVGGVVGLRLVLLSGDWIPVSLPGRAWSVLGSGVELVSLGGATEASIWSICFPIVGVDSGWSSVPYGVALGGQSVYVLDEWLERCPVWVAGELFIGGVGVALGYWGDAERTAGSFVVHPVSGERLYRTGDVGRYLPDGVIEFLGREDFQVKVGGFRIELGEVEVVLGEYPGVSSVVVVAVGDPRGSRRLVAYVVGVGVDGVGLREWARERLPEYMVPSAVVLVDGLPLTGNGKVDRAALPDPDRVVVGREFVEPRSPGEVVLARVWCGLLNRDRISTGDNVFELGADSLLALRATAAIDGHGLRLSLRDIFDNPTIAAQAEVARISTVDYDAADPVGPSGMTPSQRWFLSQDLPERHHWNDASFLLALQRPLDVPTLEAALARIIAHHDALRMRFTGEPWRAEVIPAEPAEPLPFSIHDLSGSDGPAQKRATVEISDRLQASLDLAHGPLLRVAYFDMGTRPHCVLFLAHWLVVDHYSGRVVLEDLMGCYEQLLAGGQAELPAKTTSFREWTRLLAEYAHSPEVAGELEYWTAPERRNADRPAVDHHTGDNDLPSLKNVVLRLGYRETEALVSELPKATGADVSEALCAVLLRTLPVADPGSAGRRRLLVDLERHGRDIAVGEVNLSRTVGRFSTLIPSLLDLDLSIPVDEAVAEVHRQLGEMPGRGAGHGLLRYLGDGAEALAAMPAPDVGVNYLGRVDEAFLRSDLLSVPRMSYGTPRSSVGRRFRLIDVVGYVVAGRLTLTIGYSTNRHDPRTIDQFVSAFEEQLTQLATRLAELDQEL